MQCWTGFYCSRRSVHVVVFATTKASAKRADGACDVADEIKEPEPKKACDVADEIKEPEPKDKEANQTRV